MCHSDWSWDLWAGTKNPTLMWGGPVGTLFVMVCCKKHPFVWKCLNNFVADYGTFPTYWKILTLMDHSSVYKLLHCFKNTWTLRFKSQLTFASFAAVNHFSRPLRKQTFTSTGSKGHRLWIVIVGFWFILVFLCFKIRCF